MFVVEQLSCCSEVEGIESTVAVDVEVGTEVNNHVSCSEVMADTKQTERKQNSGQQGMPATFPNWGKPGGKAARHLASRNDESSDDESHESNPESEPDNNNNTVKATVRAGKCHHLNGRARVYKRPKGVKRKYRPGIGPLHEIRHYQWESGTICSRIVCARLFREICQKVKEGLMWQASAILALQEGFEDYLVTLFHDTVLAAIHGRHKTVMPKDIHIVRQLCGETDPYAGSISMRDVPKNIARKRKRAQEVDEFGNNIY